MVLPTYFNACAGTHAPTHSRSDGEVNAPSQDAMNWVAPDFMGWCRNLDRLFAGREALRSPLERLFLVKLALIYTTGYHNMHSD